MIRKIRTDKNEKNFDVVYFFKWCHKTFKAFPWKFTLTLNICTVIVLSALTLNTIVYRSIQYLLNTIEIQTSDILMLKAVKIYSLNN